MSTIKIQVKISKIISWCEDISLDFQCGIFYICGSQFDLDASLLVKVSVLIFISLIFLAKIL